MTLKEWMQQRRWTIPALAYHLERPEKTVRKWANGERIPGADEMANIHAKTDGDVTPNDFYDLGTEPRTTMPVEEDGGARAG